MSNYAESKKQIDSVRDKYGDIVFRMSISHLMDVGIRHLTEENVEETCKQLMQKDDSKSFMTNGFQCSLVRAAYELAQIPHIDLLVYIQREVAYDVFDGVPSYERMTILLDRCISWIADDYYECASALDTFENLGFDDEELEVLGFGYLLSVRDDEDELVFVNNRYSSDDPGFDEYDIKEKK